MSDSPSRPQSGGRGDKKTNSKKTMHSCKRPGPRHGVALKGDSAGGHFITW